MTAQHDASVLRWSGSQLLTSAGDTHGRLSAKTVVLLPWLDSSMAQTALQTMAWRAGAPAVYLALHDDTGMGPVALLNAALARVDCEMVAYTAQDAFPGRYWLRNALACLHSQPNKGLLAFNDGKWFGQLAAFGLVRRAWLRGVYGGDLFFSGYRHHYGDTELTVVALQQEALAYDPHCVLIEVDHGKDQRTVDVHDRHLYLRRAAQGFDARVVDEALLKRFC